MQDAGRKFEGILKDFRIKDAVLPFVNNVDAGFISGAADIRSSLVRQLSQSVLWEDCIRAIASKGIKTFIEVGPGKVLSGLVKRIEAGAVIFKRRKYGEPRQDALRALGDSVVIDVRGRHHPEHIKEFKRHLEGFCTVHERLRCSWIITGMTSGSSRCISGPAERSIQLRKRTTICG